MRALCVTAIVPLLLCQAALAGEPYAESRALFCRAKADSQRLILLERLGRLEVSAEKPKALSDEAFKLIQSFVHEASKESCEEGWSLGYAFAVGYDLPALNDGPYGE